MGAVNIFLGGTGKVVAEDIQDSRDFYGLGISEPIAFDLNARIRDGVRLSLVVPGSDAAAGVAELARDWSTRDPGSGVGPESGARQPGPQRSPEHSLLVKIGEGIARDPAPSAGLFALRAHGLAVFSMLFDPGKALAGTGAGNELRNHIEDRVTSQTFDGRPPRITLITSTAGGTGAGTVIPLALWLRKHYANSELNLVAVTPSAFSRVLRGNADLNELAAKGRSGTYAMLRELSFFSPAPDPQTTFSPRGLPVTQGDLAYRPGRQDRQLFDRAYWFGGRGGGPEDAFEEAGALVRLLSYDGSAEDLAAETGGNPMQWVGAVTAIEYPKLRYQRRMISSVLQAAYRALRQAPEGFAGTAPDATTLMAYVNDQTTRTLGRLGGWFNANRHGPLAAGGSATTVDADAADALARSIRSRAGADAALREIVPHGTQIQGANYRSDTPGWRAYVGAVTDNLDREASRRQEAVQRTIREMRREEERAFGEWLAKEVIESRLSGDGRAPTPTDEVVRLLDHLERDASDLEQHFENDLFPAEKTLDGCDDEIRQAKDRFDNPPPAQASLSGPERIVTMLAGLGALAVVLAVARLIPGFDVATIDSTWFAWVVAAVAMLVVYRGARWLLLRGKQEAASLHERRRRSEQSLFTAYAERDRVRALRWMHQELRGGGGQTAFFRELRRQVDAARSAVDRLASVYEGLEDKATAEASQASVSPPHVVAEVGECIIADPNVAENIVRELQQRLRVDTHASPEPRMQDLTVRLVHADEDKANEFDPAAGDAIQILQALQAEEQAGLVDAQRVESRWRESVWKLINWKLGQNLPEDFGAALAYCEGDSVAATRSLATKLAGVSLPRQPSVGLMTQASAPARRRVYVGSGAIEGEFNRAMQAPEIGAMSTAFAVYDNPIVVPALGQQIVFLDLWVDPGDQEWAPGVIGSATDADRAIGTYYATEPGVPPAATAAETCFTVVPELLAATKLELGGVVAPLAPSVVARLLGSDLDTRGPTYAELFYLLRARGWLRSAREGDGPEAREVTSIADGGAAGGRAAKLVAWRRGGLSDQTMFGAGRDVVVMFDAFCEFMRFKGTPVIAGASRDGYAYPGADLFAGDWAGDPDAAAALQRSVVMQWYEGDVPGDSAAMIEVLEQDLSRMHAGPERSSWERAMRRLLAGEERRAIRATHVNRPAG